MVLVIAAGAAGVMSTTAEAASCDTSTADVYTPTTMMNGVFDWSTPGNWSSNAPPSGVQVACWEAGTTVTVTDGESVDSIEASGDLAIIGAGTLTLTSSSSVTDLSLEGGELDGTSGQTLTLTGNFDWGGSGSASAALNAAPGSGLAINETGGGGFSLTIDGSASDPAFDGGSIATNSPVTISNPNLTDANTPTLTANAGVTFAGVALASNATPGTITTTGISNTGTSSVLGFGVHLISGAAGALAGSLTLASLDTDSGTTLPVASGATLSVGSGTIAGTIDGAGTFTGGAGGSTTTIAGTGNLSTANVAVGTGDLTVEDLAAYNAGTQTTIVSGTLDLGTSGTTGTLSLTGGGQLTGSAGNTLTVAGGFQWTSGTVSPDGGSIAVGGTITVGFGAQTAGSPGTFSAAGVLAGRGVAGTYGFGTSSLVLTGGTSTVASGNTLVSGPLSVPGGALRDDGTVNANATTITGGTLEGTGTVDGPVTNTSGTVAPGDAAPGVLSVTGNYAQGGGGTLAIEINGTTAGSGFSRLQVTGGAGLGGSLALTDGGGFVPGPSDTFEVIGSGGHSGVFTLTGPSKELYVANYSDPGAVTLALNPTPANLGAPAITGSPSLGQTLSCAPGIWTTAPTAFGYQWNRDGSPIAGATSGTYVVSTADRGHALTCTVTASNRFGTGQPATSAAVSIPAPPSAPSAPFNITVPGVSGTPTPGNQLSCSPGAWLERPTGFAYLWLRNGSALAGATGSTYVVKIADEGASLTCTVTATNAGGQAAASSTAIVVALPATLTCAKPTGKLSGRSLGPLQLGFTRRRARRAVKRYAKVGGSQDDFCLYGGWGINAGYPSNKLLSTVSAGERRRLKGRIVLALTSNPYYALGPARPGMALTAVAKKLHLGKPITAGPNRWYLIPGSASRGVVKVRGGLIEEVGIATEAFTATRKAGQRFLSAFSRA